MRNMIMRAGEALGCMTESWTLSVPFLHPGPGETIVHKHLCKLCLVMRGAVLVVLAVGAVVLPWSVFVGV
jgi:hypothetical protein